jgi:hypothetical protein
MSETVSLTMKKLAKCRDQYVRNRKLDNEETGKINMQNIMAKILGEIIQ